MQNLIRGIVKKALKEELKKYNDYFGNTYKKNTKQIKTLTNFSTLEYLFSARVGTIIDFKKSALNAFAWAIYWIKIYTMNIKK